MKRSENRVMPRVHRRQFVIGPHPIKPNEHWRSAGLGEGLWLSYDEDLPVLEGPGSRRGERVFLLGTAIDAHAGAPVTGGQLPSATLRGYLRATERWVGRWALILDGTIAGDIGGLLGVLHDTRGAGAGGLTWVSSSQALLCMALGRPLDLRPNATISPATRVAGVERLLPGQGLNLRTGKVTLLDNEPFRAVGLGEDETLELACSLVLGAVRGFATASADGGLFIGLSGGSDSRRNAAAAKAAGIPTTLYTFKKPWAYMSDADAKLPAVVAARLRLPHREISVDSFASSRGDDWKAHVGSAEAEPVLPGSNFYYYSRGFWQELGYPATTVEGQCYELTSNYYYPDFWRIGRDFAAADCAGAHCACSEDELTRTEEFWSSLRIDLEMDRRDLLFWSFAMNSVYSNLYFESDLWTDAYCTANCGLLYSSMLSLPPGTRGGKKFLDRVTLRLAPSWRAFR